MDTNLIGQYGPALLAGFGVTILCWLFGTVFGMALGLLIALVQRYGPRWVGWIIQIYIEVIRGTPFLVQLFVLYYGGPLIGLRLDALPAGLLGLTIYGSPYFAEIFRAGLNAVPVGQIEAARAMGMPPVLLARRITLPLMLAAAIPGLANLWLIATKDTALLAVVGFSELTLVTRQAAGTTKAYMLFFCAAGVLYLLLTLVSNVVIGIIERRARRGIAEPV